MVHWVYICTNLKPPLVGQQCDQVEGCNTTNPVISSFPNFVLKKTDKSQEGENSWFHPTTYPPTKIKLRGVCCQEGEDDEDMTPSDTTTDYIMVSSFQMNLSCGCQNNYYLMI